MEEYASWPTKEDVQQELGISERTLDRRINELSIKKEFRQVAGRKPVPLLDPDGVAKLKELHEHPHPVVVKTPSRQLPQKYQNGHVVTVQPPAAMQTETLPALPPAVGQALTEWFANLTGPVYLALKDAAIQTGLPQSHLKQAIKEGRLRAVKVARSWRLLRGDVIAYRVAE